LALQLLLVVARVVVATRNTPTLTVATVEAAEAEPTPMVLAVRVFLARETAGEITITPREMEQPLEAVVVLTPQDKHLPTIRAATAAQENSGLTAFTTLAAVEAVVSVVLVREVSAEAELLAITQTRATLPQILAAAAVELAQVPILVSMAATVEVE